MTKVLFICKRRIDSWSKDQPYAVEGFSSGLYNSANFVVKMLNDAGTEAKLIDVIDNNCIDREVTKYKPTHVIIEAYWVVPEKFDVLIKLHPDVEWIVRNHSETPFAANEGIIIDWSFGYIERGVKLSCNAPRALHDFRTILM
jgi:hypothetical protein